MEKTRQTTVARVTMKDIAVHAGVSQSTVSFVLNGQEGMRISDETRKRVMDAASELGYRARGAGRPPREAGLRFIGMMLDEVATSPFAAISIEGLQEEALKHNVLVEVVMTRGDRTYETAMLRKWEDERVEGVVYGSILTRNVRPPDALSKHMAVLLNCYDGDRRFRSVVPAERRGGEAATRMLVAAGHRKIAFVSGESWMEAADQRLEGYQRALRSAGIPIDPNLILEGNFLPSGGYAATHRLMDGPMRPDAIFCANALMAVGCYEALKERGERIGETIAVMGYDDQEIAQHLSPALTTVLLPHREMGAWCADVLLSEATVTEHQYRIECPVMVRKSHLKA